MKSFKELQSDIKSKYPDFKTLPFFTRIKIRFNQYPSTCVDSIEVGFEKKSQTYKTFSHEGKIYFYKFGW